MIPVTCALIEHNGRLLAAQRSSPPELAGLWEFPGGKVEPNESPEACLIREIKEELNLDIAITQALTPSLHTYPTKTIELIPFRCHLTSPLDNLQLNDHQAVRWLHADEVENLPWAPADLPILREWITTSKD